MPHAEPVITLRDAAVRVGDRTLWSGVTVSVAPGEFVSVLGPKSLLVNLAYRLRGAGEMRVLVRQGRRVGYRRPQLAGSAA